VQSKYIPRGIVYNHAAGVRTFVWLLTAGVDGNEYDDFGLVHGRRELPDDFTPRPVYYALQNTNALFGDTKLDASIVIEHNDVAALRRQAKAPIFEYGSRNKNGKAIVAYWVAAHSNPGGAYPPIAITLKVKNSGIKKPVLIDVVSGDIAPLEFKRGSADTLESLPLRDSVMAIADADYFDWPVLPEAPSGLTARGALALPELSWDLHGQFLTKVVIEERLKSGAWKRSESPVVTNVRLIRSDPYEYDQCYRVRAVSLAGESAYSNIACINR
jgi:hypothetical protein